MAENLNTVVILNNIRSSENVGSIFRTADAFGVQKIYLCGYTPAPLDRFNRKNTKLTKASLGAEEFVSWEKVEKLEDVVARLKKCKNYSSAHTSECADIFLLENSSCSAQSASQGIHKYVHSNNFSAEKYPCITEHTHEEKTLIIGVEQSENSIDYREIKSSKLLAPNSKLVLVFGNETEGLSKEDLKLCDAVVEIPMQGKKESLNVAVSVGIILSEIVK